MLKHSYDLLSIEGAPEGDRPFRLKGILTQQGVDLLARFPMLAALPALQSPPPAGEEVRLLGLDFEVDPDRMTVSWEATGPLAPLAQGELSRLRAAVERFAHPIALRDGGIVYNLYQPPVPSLRLVKHMARLLTQGREEIKPTTCTLQVTTRCQLVCFHCSAAKYKTRERSELSTEEFLSVIRQSLDMGIFNITFTGGEPLLREDIFDLIAAVDRDRAHASMFTNGLLLTEENVARLVDAGLHSVMVSIDDPRPEVHDELRGLPGCFEKAIAGMQRAREAGLLTALSTYVSGQDVREGRVEQLIELARELNCHEITIFDVVPTGSLLPMEEECLITPEERRRIIAAARHYSALPGYPNVVAQSEVEGPECAGCMGAHSQFYMTAFGDVDPCDFMPLTFGNVRDDPLEVIWQRMRSHPAFVVHADHCLMQDREFRREYIDPIPKDRLLPWPACEELKGRPNTPPPVKLNLRERCVPSAGKVRYKTLTPEGDVVSRAGSCE